MTGAARGSRLPATLAKQLASKKVPREVVELLLGQKQHREHPYGHLSPGVQRPQKLARVPTKVSAATTHTPGLDTNLFAYLLAARTKQDVHTKLVAPKTMWTKIAAEGLVLKPVDWKFRTVGPRGYQTPALSEVSKGFQHILARRAFYKKYKHIEEFSHAIEELEASILQRLVNEYEPEGPVILPHASISGVPNCPNIPAQITVGKNKSGVPLAAYIHRLQTIADLISESSQIKPKKKKSDQEK